MADIIDMATGKLLARVDNGVVTDPCDHTKPDTNFPISLAVKNDRLYCVGFCSHCGAMVHAEDITYHDRPWSIPVPHEALVQPFEPNETREKWPKGYYRTVATCDLLDQLRAHTDIVKRWHEASHAGRRRKEVTFRLLTMNRIMMALRKLNAW